MGRASPGRAALPHFSGCSLLRLPNYLQTALPAHLPQQLFVSPPPRASLAKFAREESQLACQLGTKIPRALSPPLGSGDLSC